jgi:hypothetical protein
VNAFAQSLREQLRIAVAEITVNWAQLQCVEVCGDERERPLDSIFSATLLREIVRANAF